MSKKQPSAVPRRHYDDQFKEEAVRLVTAGQRSVPNVARSLGISANILYRWKELAQASGTPLTNQTELNHLREQLRRTEQERDILKKALAIFSRMT